MKSNEPMESMLRRLRYQATAARRERTLQNIYHAMDESQEPAPADRRVHLGRMTMNTRITKYAIAAAVILIVLGGVSLWPEGGGGRDRWWLAPPAAWGQELLTALGTVQVVSGREQTVLVAADGTQHTSSTWDAFYVSKDSYRRDIYDGQVLREIQWYVPEDSDMIQHYIRYDLNCYGATRHKGSFGVTDPVERMRFFIGLLDKADTVLGEETIDGHACVGFEIRASKYGSNPDAWIDRIWFDTQTKLPARMERSGRPVTGDAARTFTTIMNQFTYNAQLPADTFVPQAPPKGFINAHPDDLPRK
jgi:hypothetical protein